MNRSPNFRTDLCRMRLRLLPLVLALALPAIPKAHEHLAAGAQLPEAGSALLFVNAANYATESGYVVPLELSTNGPYAGYHHAELTFVCQPATPDRGGPAPFHPVPGTHVDAVIETVEGPAGGSLGFWESPGDEITATELTFSVPVGETQGTRGFPVSENDGSPDADPFGHIHGRVFSATEPGLYRVGFRFVDTSSNGPGGGPLHAPSPRFFLHFQSGITLAHIQVGTEGLEVTFAAANDFRYFIEERPQLDGPAPWAPIGDPVTGDNHLHTVALGTGGDVRFLRLRREPL
ncbi:MAG: hypothetical protein JNL10_00185 [Verrucomicrobiales bacterium]|nr:hypothetical protein [Verrucomicrobiales bacterium]